MLALRLLRLELNSEGATRMIPTPCCKRSMESPPPDREIYSWASEEQLDKKRSCVP